MDSAWLALAALILAALAILAIKRWAPGAMSRALGRFLRMMAAIGAAVARLGLWW